MDYLEVLSDGSVITSETLKDFARKKTRRLAHYDLQGTVLSTVKLPEDDPLQIAAVNLSGVCCIAVH